MKLKEGSINYSSSNYDEGFPLVLATPEDYSDVVEDYKNDGASEEEIPTEELYYEMFYDDAKTDLETAEDACKIDELTYWDFEVEPGYYEGIQLNIERSDNGIFWDSANNYNSIYNFVNTVEDYKDLAPEVDLEKLKAIPDDDYVWDDVEDYFKSIGTTLNDFVNKMDDLLADKERLEIAKFLKYLIENSITWKLTGPYGWTGSKEYTEEQYDHYFATGEIPYKVKESKLREEKTALNWKNDIAWAVNSALKDCQDFMDNKEAYITDPDSLEKILRDLNYDFRSYADVFKNALIQINSER